jgi:hypothetical protein
LRTPSIKKGGVQPAAKSKTFLKNTTLEFAADLSLQKLQQLATG